MNQYWMYTNADPMNRGYLTQEEMDRLLQILHKENAEGEDDTIISLLTKIMEWEGDK